MFLKQAVLKIFELRNAHVLSKTFSRIFIEVSENCIWLKLEFGNIYDKNLMILGSYENKKVKDCLCSTICNLNQDINVV